MQTMTANRRHTLLPVLLAGVVSLLTGCHIVEPGTAGVKLVWGEVQSPALPEGFAWINPVSTKVVNLSTRVQKVQAEAVASSKDLQVVTTTVALNYKVGRDAAIKVFQGIGNLPMLERTIVQPALQEAIKGSTALFTAAELITRRTEVKTKILEYIRESMGRSDLTVTDLSIMNFQFTTNYQSAVEDKQVAEELAKKAENDLSRIRIEAKQKEESARGEAEAMLALARAEAKAQEMLRNTITKEIVRLRAIEKWDGKMPVVSGGDSAAPVDIAGLVGKR